jgi:hypothetical protein
MYTVIRFAATEAGLQAVHRLIATICDAEQCTNIRSSAFSCDISDSNTWNAHVEAIEAFLLKLGTVLPKARECEAKLHVSVDVAIEPEDRGDRPYVPLVFPRTLLGQLVQAGIGLEITSYVVSVAEIGNRPGFAFRGLDKK